MPRMPCSEPGSPAWQVSKCSRTLFPKIDLLLSRRFSLTPRMSSSASKSEVRTEEMTGVSIGGRSLIMPQEHHELVLVIIET